MSEAARGIRRILDDPSFEKLGPEQFRILRLALSELDTLTHELNTVNKRLERSVSLHQVNVLLDEIQRLKKEVRKLHDLSG
jgi:hypothetical protein